MSCHNGGKIGRLSCLVEGLNKKKICYREGLDIHQFCSFWGAYDVLSYISDAVVLVHGASGCLGNSRFLLSMGYHTTCDLQPHYSTRLGNKDIIFGGEKKLTESILEVNRIDDPPIIFVLTNCCVDIIGDDVDGCIQELPDHIRSKVFYLNTGGFSGKSFRDGTDRAFEMLGALVGKAKPGTATNKDSINLFIRRWIWEETCHEEIAEIEFTFKSLGITLNQIFKRGLSLKDFYQFSTAQLNVSLCASFSKGLFRHMDKEYGIPFVESSYPIGLLATVKWLREITDKLGKSIDVNSLDEVVELEALRQEVMEKIGENRHCVIWAYKGERTISLVKLAQELGLIPIVVNMEPSVVNDKLDFFDKEVKEGLDFDIFVSNNPEEVESLLDSLNHPIVICNDNVFPNFPVVRHRFAYNQVYGLGGTKKLYAAIVESLTIKQGKYALFLRG